MTSIGSHIQMDQAITGQVIKGLTSDSRAVKPGYLFAALPGTKSDGRDYIPSALRQGAAAILAPSGTLPQPGSTVPVIESAEPRRAFALMAAAFYGKQPETIAAITGTSGKTSVAQFARQIWSHLGLQAASIGTLGVIAPDIDRYGSLTTPDPVELHADLAMLANRGVTHVAMEASSGGLDQFRMDGVRVSAAAFTNFSRDHLDYHLDMDAYFAAKLRLFQSLLRDDGTAVLNANIPEYEPLRAVSESRGLAVLSYGQTPNHNSTPDLGLTTTTPLPHGQVLDLAVRGHAYRVTLKLMGSFQAMNVLAALGLVLASGEDQDKTIAALEHLTGVSGRAELVATAPNGAQIFVDYAHKPGALETVLLALRPHVTGRLVLVFGCGGDRDRGKRPLMGEIATRLADKVYVTDDNPRSEDPASIRAEIMAAAPGAIEIGDRAQAIYQATKDLNPTDLLIIAGKGHEHGQIVGSVTSPFNDAEVARASVASLA
jgi:UDP-N-acetylmuramoyl-L-alanyl-D-glutamate--2,6-diaminopimelate ligase